MMQSNRGKVIEPLLLAALALTCSHLSRGGAAAAAAAHVPFQPTAAEQLLFIYALVFAVLAVASFMVMRKGLSLCGFVLQECRAEISRHGERRAAIAARWRWIALSALCLIAVAVRVAFLGQPMRYDESASFLVFVNESISRAFYYPVPNNHVLNSLLERLSCAVMGTGPVAIRLPAFVAGVALVPSISSLCRKMEPDSGLIAAAGVAAMPFLVSYSTNGRGYTLLCLLTVLILRQSLARGGDRVSTHWGHAALLSALGMWVMPSMLFVVASVGLWVTACLALDSTNGPRRALGYAIAYGTATALLTLVLYTPVVLASDGFESLLSNSFVRPLPYERFFATVVPHWLETFSDFSRDVPVVVAGLVVVAAVGSMFIAARSGQLALGLLLPAFIIGTACVFFAKRSIPYPRTWIYLIPVVFVCADITCTRLCLPLARSIRMVLVAGVCLGALAVAGRLVVTDAVSRYPDTGAFVPAEEAAGRLAPIITGGDEVCAQLPADAPTAYYVWRSVAPEAYASRPRTSRKFFIDDARRHYVTPAIADAHMLVSTPGYRLYEWSGAGDVPGSACWWPALLPARR